MKTEQAAAAAGAQGANGLTGTGAETFALEGLGQRIADVADGLGGKRNLARRSGVHETQLYKYIRGASAPSLGVCLAIARAGGVSLDWLVSGEGSAQPSAPGITWVQRYPAEVCPMQLPWPGSVAAIEPLPLNPVELQQRGLAEHSLVAVQVPRGQGGAPLEEGGTVLIDRAAPGLAGDGLYLVELGATLRVQRLQFQVDGSLTLLAINPRFRDLHLPVKRLGELSVIGRVLWFCSWQG
ncbi:MULTISPECIES: XRE family transcriptional regulator [Pseudomonas]|uniref:Helix-turn-helix domain-containing protein n=1 Tax=Pseudomonas eucalypticola TaxID=2599595 RepID=A0A7D5D6C4_9PSED|nr:MULTISPECIES: helix-turn-helix domain-containing protein [Pseudomonas]QKZ04334.1 helix-turn-helix domain-containing protein [Pseudomonas eucalypticola]